jgi:hypothetical protein
MGRPESDARIVTLAYDRPGQLAEVQVGGEEPATGWRLDGDILTAPDRTRWLFEPNDASCYGVRAEWYGTIRAAPPADRGAAQWAAPPGQLRAAGQLLRQLHPVSDAAWRFWTELAGVLEDAAAIGEHGDPGAMPFTWHRWSDLVAVARSYLDAPHLAGRPAGAAPIPREVLASIAAIITRGWDSARRSYAGSHPGDPVRDGHIFPDYMRVREWLDQIAVAAREPA